MYICITMYYYVCMCIYIYTHALSLKDKNVFSNHSLAQRHVVLSASRVQGEVIMEVELPDALGFWAHASGHMTSAVKTPPELSPKIEKCHPQTVTESSINT